MIFRKSLFSRRSIRVEILFLCSVLKRLFIFVAYPICLAFSLSFRIMQSLLYGAIALLFASMLKTDLPYPAGVRLAVVAVTPVLLLDTLLSLTGLSIPFWWLLARRRRRKNAGV